MKEHLRVGPYEFLSPLGSGGQGSVWLAKDTRDGGQVAVKLLPPGQWGAIELGRVRRESRLLLTFSDPGLPSGIGVIEDASQRVYGFVMQYVEATPLLQVIRDRELSPVQVAAFASELARILSVLHDKGVVHRDVKMNNVLVRDGWDEGRTGSIVLVDLGIARGLESNAASAYGGLVGSAPYVAPELLFWTGEIGPSAAVDVFALGVLIWILLFKRHPTGLPMSADFSEFLEVYRNGAFVVPDAKRASEVQNKLPGLLPILYRCLEFSLSRRYANGTELHAALEGLVADHPEIAPTQPLLLAPKVERKSPIPLLVFAFILVAAATIAGVIWVLK